MASALFESLMTSGGGAITSKISETTERMTMKFSTDIKLDSEAQKN